MRKTTNIFVISMIALMAAGAARADVASVSFVADQVAAKANVDDVYTMDEVNELLDSVEAKIPTGTLASKNAVDTDLIVNKAVTKDKLADAVQASLGRADTALQGVPVATADDMGGVKSGGDISVSAAGVVTVSHAATAGSATTANSATTATSATTAATADKATADAAGNVFTTHYATKAEIPAAQVQSDWNATTGVAAIANKPTLATVATSGKYSDLSGTPTIPAAQVQSDWNATTGVAAIANKPTLATVATSGSYNDLANKPSIPAGALASKNSITNADVAENAAIAASKINGLATVATSGKYSDLSGTPTIPAAQVQSDWNATTGVAAIANKPTIPSKTSDLTNDSNFATTADVTSAIDALDSTSSGTGAVVTGVSQTNGVVSVTKGNVQIPVGSATGTTYATIWVQ